MGVALIVAPLMLLFLAAPFLYLIFFVIVCKIVNRGTRQERVLALAVTLLIFSLYPGKLYIEYFDFSKSCETSRPPIITAPIADVNRIAFVSEGGDFVDIPYIWYREMRLNLKRYEHAYLVNGKESMRKLCDWGTDNCIDGGKVTSRYMFLVTAPKKNSKGILQSNISVVDRLKGTTLYEAHEFVLSGPIAAYHGAFLAKKNHRGYLSCGYLGKSIDVWRPNDSNIARYRYAETDSWILTTIFPSLK